MPVKKIVLSVLVPDLMNVQNAKKDSKMKTETVSKNAQMENSMKNLITIVNVVTHYVLTVLDLM